MAEPVAPHVLVIPYPSQGHMLPLLDLVHLLSSRARLAVTIVVTTNNQPLLDPLLSRSPSVAPLVLPFPDYPALPPGLENAKDLPHAFFRPLLHALAASKTPSSAGLAPLPTPPPPSSPTTCSAGPPTSPPSWTSRRDHDVAGRLPGRVGAAGGLREPADSGAAAGGGAGAERGEVYLVREGGDGGAGGV